MKLSEIRNYFLNYINDFVNKYFIHTEFNDYLLYHRNPVGEVFKNIDFRKLTSTKGSLLFHKHFHNPRIPASKSSFQHS